MRARGSKAARGLVEQQQLRIVDEHPGEADPLLHAAREAVDEIVLAPLHVGECEHVADDLVASLLGEPIGRAKEIEILEDGHLPIHREVVGHETNLPADLVAVGGHTAPEDLDLAALRASLERAARSLSVVVLPAPLGPTKP